MVLPFFYGWLIVVVTMVAGFFSAGVSNVVMAVMLKPISAELGWSRALTAAGITAGALLGGVLSPFFGPVADRFGPRILLPAGGALVGLLAITLGFSSEPWQFYATFIPARALTEFLLCGIVPLTAITNWFYFKRPRAMGLTVMSVPLGAAALSVVYQFFVSYYGWRSAFFALGLSLWVLVAIPGAIFLRRQPEDMGLRPDGMDAAPRDIEYEGNAHIGASIEEREHSLTRSAAVRTSTLWLLVASTFLASIGTGGVAFHTVAYLTDVDVAPAVAAGALGIMALSGALGNVLWGGLAEKIHPRRLNMTTMVFSAGAIALLMGVNDPPTAYLFAVLFGFCARGAAVLTQILVARFFGRRSYGAISSILDPFHKGGLGLGPLFAGVAFDLTGNYQTIFAIFLANFLVAALLILFARNPASIGRG